MNLTFQPCSASSRRTLPTDPNALGQHKEDAISFHRGNEKAWDLKGKEEIIERFEIGLSWRSRGKNELNSSIAKSKEEAEKCCCRNRSANSSPAGSPMLTQHCMLWCMTSLSKLKALPQWPGGNRIETEADASHKKEKQIASTVHMWFQFRDL